MKLEKLYQIIEDRKKKMPEDSYIVSLFRDGNDRIIQKVGEEAVEVVIAAKNNKKEQLISEVADLWFHTLVMLSALDITPEEIFDELENRYRKKKINS